MAILNLKLTKFYIIFFTVWNMFKLIKVEFIEQNFENVNIQNLKFKLLIIFSGLYKIRIIILKFNCTFSEFIMTKKMCLNAQKNHF